MRESYGLYRKSRAGFVTAKRAPGILCRRGQEDDRHVRSARAAAHQFGEFEAVHAGHVDIEDGERDFVLEQQFERRWPRPGGEHGNIRPRQRRFQRSDVVLHIVYDQDVNWRPDSLPV